MFAPGPSGHRLPFSLPLSLTSFVTWPAIIVMLVAAFAIAVTTENRSSERSRLADHGVTTIARIDNVDVPGRRRRDATLSISFETADGTTVQGNIRVNRGFGKRVRDEAAPSTIKVVYLPESPGVVRPADEKDPAKWRYLLAWVLAGGAIAAAIVRLRARG